MRRSDEIRAAVVAEARSWVGTTYRHQARVKDRGVDCVGLIIAAGLAADAIDWSEEAFAPWRGYGRLPNPAKMREGLERFLTPVPAGAGIMPGDVAWFSWREGLPMHLGILAEFRDDEAGVPPRLTIIHATQTIGRVVEHSFAGEWPSRVDSWWTYPPLMEDRK